MICYYLVMHIVQSKILDKLTYAKELRYSQIRPQRIESNLFAYHLKELLKDGYIEKNDKLYTLTAKGKSHVDKISHRSLKVRQQPKIITLLDITNSKGQTMIYRRKHQPFIGMLSYPSGKLHMYEHIAEAANREVREKLEFSKVTLEHRGIVYMAYREDGENISQVLAHVFHGAYNHEFERDDTLRATRFWADPKKYDKKEFVPGFWEIKKLLKQKDFFFDEFFFDLKDYS